ncbi:MAG: hypothetical protein Q9221_004704 [Calogaya cf. arnoldii]
MRDQCRRMVKFRGRYWVFHHKVYGHLLKRVGGTLVSSIPSGPEEYREWLKATREFYSNWDTLLQTTFLCIQPNQVNNIEHDNTLSDTLDEAFNGRMEREFPTHRPGQHNYQNNIFYSFDLDLEVFSIDKQAHYRLGNIPRDDQWIKALFVDDNRRRFVHPHLAPEESLGSLAIDNRQFTAEHTKLWESLKKQELTPKSSNVLAKLRSRLFDIFEDNERHDLATTVLSWSAEDLALREYAFCILCMAAGGEHLTFVDQRRIAEQQYFHSNLWAAVVCGDDPKGERELLSGLATGFHVKDQPQGSAPQTSKYWFEGALVCLVPRLDQPYVATRAIANAVRYAKDEFGRTSFDAVLISIVDVVLLRCHLDGSIQYSPIMSLLDNRGVSCKNARQRYDNAIPDGFRKQQEQERDWGSGAVSPRYEPKRSGPANGTALVPEMNVELTFLRLVNFFDATAVCPSMGASDTSNTSMSRTPTGRELPPEITGMILHYVADIATFNACLKVSKTFRTICNKRPLVLDDVVLHNPVSPGQTVSLMLKRAYSECRNEEYKVDFHATLQSSGQQTNIHIGLGNNQYAYSYAVGSGFNRKSRVGQISFCGLELPEPLKEPIEPRTRYRPGYQGEKIDLWDTYLVRLNVPNIGNVRLFEWQQADGQALNTSKEQSFDGTLTELKPGKVYSLLDREGRKDIDVVIKSARERFDKAPRDEEAVEEARQRGQKWREERRQRWRDEGLDPDEEEKREDEYWGIM